jgi:2-polyprenyl-3-methyl-5-hydroxy-6-metoxy-1,4-benzoquinol methylase
MEENNRQCPICDSENKRQIKHIKNIVPSDFILPAEYDMVVCNNCGFVFNDVPDSNCYDEYYSKYKENTNFSIPSETGYIHTKEKRESRYFTSVDFIKNSTKMSQSAAILDIGCSFGGILTILKNEGFSNLSALDLDTVSIGCLREIGINSKEGSIFSEDMPEYENKFDLIILGHILEHLHEPKKAISNISRWLKNDGKVYIECPDLYQYPQTSPFPGFFAEWEHINHFSIVSLMNLMNNYSLKSYCTGTIYALIEEFPCLYALFEKSSQINELCKTRNDEKSMLRSLSIPTEKGVKTLAHIEKLKDNDIAIWGAGQYCYMLLSNTPLSSCNIQYIVDKDEKKHGKSILGLEITGPQNLKDFNGTIVVCSTTAKDHIVSDIQKMGLTNDVAIPFI